MTHLLRPAQETVPTNLVSHGETSLQTNPIQGEDSPRFPSSISSASLEQIQIQTAPLRTFLTSQRKGSPMRMHSMKLSSRLVIAMVIAAACSGVAYAQTWVQVGSGGGPGSAPGGGSASATTCLLLTDGSVMCQENANPCCSGVDPTKWWRFSPDNFGHYETGTWSQLQSAPAGYGPLFYCSAVLMDGRVVVIGGEYNNAGGGGETTLGYIFDPTQNGGTGQWTSSPISLGATGWTKIGDSICTLLSDGTFIIGDGDNAPYPSSYQTASLDLATQTLVLLNSPALENSRAAYNGEVGWTLLPDGTVLSVDTQTQGETGSEIFTPAANQTTNPGPYDVWSSAGSTIVSLPNNGGMSIGPEMGPQVLRPDGTVIAFGSTQNTAIYNTLTKTWSVGPSFSTYSPTDSCFDAPASLLPSGNVLVDAGNLFNNGAHFYEFDGTNLNPITGPPSAGGDAPFQTRMLLLPTGQILYTDTSSDVELYTSANTAFQDAWRPTITGAPTSVEAGSTYIVYGTQFNGLSQASAFGDDATMSTNYPLVRFKNHATGHIFYARTHDHSSMGVATGTAIVSTHFDAPASLESGESDLIVVANGIPSEPWVINGPTLTLPGPLSMNTCAGTSTTATLNVCNTGQENLSISGITSSNSQISVSSPSSGYSVNISPDACFPFQVNYQPTTSGTTNATLTVSSNDPNTPSVELAVTATAPAPSINTTIVNNGSFGSVCPGGQSSINLNVTNQSSCNLVINHITTSAGFLPPTVSLPLTLTADASIALPLAFDPSLSQTCSNTSPIMGTVTVNSNDPSQPGGNTTVGLSGLVPCPKISATIPNNGNFGDVCSGKVSDLNLEVLNTGQCNLNISSITSNNANFGVPAGPLVLSADANVDLPVAFQPVPYGSPGYQTCSNTTPETAKITIVSNDPSDPIFVETVQGIEGCPTLVLGPQNLTGLNAYPATVSDPTGTLGCYTDKQVTVSNTGICPLTISSLTTSNGLDGKGLALPASPLEYNVVNTKVPITVNPGGKPVPITVRFKPLILTDQNSMAPDQQTGTLNIVSNDPTAGDNTSALCGEPVYHSGARILLTDIIGNPLSSAPKLTLESQDMTPAFSEVLAPAPLQPPANVCGNTILYHLDNETLTPTGENANAFYVVLVQDKPVYYLPAKFRLNQCQMEQLVVEPIKVQQP